MCQCVFVCVFSVMVECVCAWWFEGVNMVVGNISVFLAVYVCVVLSALDMAIVVGSGNMSTITHGLNDGQPKTCMFMYICINTLSYPYMYVCIYPNIELAYVNIRICITLFRCV